MVTVAGKGAARWRDRHSHPSRVSPGCRPASSAVRESRGRGDVRFQQERACVALASAVETMVRGGDRQPRPDAPRRSPAQETPAFICRQLGDTFQIHVDAGLERRNDRRRRFAVYGDVEIGANGVPSLAASVGVALQGRHVDSAGRHATPIISRLTHSSRNGCASEGVIVSYDTRSTFIRPSEAGASNCEGRARALAGCLDLVRRAAMAYGVKRGSWVERSHGSHDSASQCRSPPARGRGLKRARPAASGARRWPGRPPRGGRGLKPSRVRRSRGNGASRPRRGGRGLN